MAWQPDYATLAELKAFVRIADTVDDAELAVAITAASRSIDAHTGRQFGLLAVPTLWSYTARPDLARGRWVVDVDDLMTVTGLLVEVPTAATVTTFTKEPVNGATKGRPWTRIVFDRNPTVHPLPIDNYTVNVTGQFGWTTVPVPVKQACLLQASRFFKRRDAPFGVAGSPDLGSEIRLLAKVDPDVAVVLTPYRRIGRVG